MIAIRNLTQKALVLIFNLFFAFSNKKIILFSKFMAKHNCDYVTKRGRVSNCNYLLNVHDIAVARRIYIGLDDEHLKTKRAISWIKERSPGKRVNVIFDIGANIGHISIPLLADGSVMQSYLWEPDPTNFRILKCNVILNGLENSVQLFNCALGSKEEALVTELSEDNFGDHRIRVSDESGIYNENSRKTISIQSKQLDVFVSGEIDTDALLVWIDVQGYEGEVLAGAKELIEKRPSLVIEFWPYGLNRAGGIEKLLSAVSKYGAFYDLALEHPKSVPTEVLMDLYLRNKADDFFTMDLLFISE